MTNIMAAYNRRLAQWRVKWLIEHSASHQLLWCIDSFVLRIPPLRQAPKRYLKHLNYSNVKNSKCQKNPYHPCRVGDINPLHLAGVITPCWG